MAIEIVIGKKPSVLATGRRPMTWRRALGYSAIAFVGWTIIDQVIFVFTRHDPGAAVLPISVSFFAFLGAVGWFLVRAVREGRYAARTGVYLEETKDLWALDSAQLDQVVTRMLGRMGYAVQRTPGGLDGAPPLTASAHRAGDVKTYHVQPVHLAEVGTDAVERLLRYLEQQHSTLHVGVLVASGFFTDEAKALAGDRVKLIDGDALMASLKEQPRPFGV